MDTRWRCGFRAIVVLGVSFATQAKAQGTLVAAAPADPQHFNPEITTASKGFNRGEANSRSRPAPSRDER